MSCNPNCKPGWLHLVITYVKAAINVHSFTSLSFLFLRQKKKQQLVILQKNENVKRKRTSCYKEQRLETPGINVKTF